MPTRPLLSACAILTAALAVACGGDDPDPNYPTGAGGYYASGGYGAQSPTSGGYGAQTPTGGYGAGTPTGQATTGAGGATAGNTATPIPPTAAAVAAPILRGLAQAEVAGSQEDGPAFAGQFQEGQVLEQPLTLHPGRCYSVVGIGVGIEELDVEIVVHQPPAPEFVAAQDQGTGPQATLGGGQSCFKNPLPIPGPAKVRVRATKGTGIALAQVYSR